MGRLTKKDDQGNWSLSGVRWEQLYVGQTITEEIWQKLYGALWKLKEYEGTDLPPDQIKILSDMYLEKCQEMNQLKKQIPVWIPVAERLPEDSEHQVLVQISGKPRANVTLEDALMLAEYDPEDGWILEVYPEWEEAAPVAWMPLPEAYCEEQLLEE